MHIHRALISIDVNPAPPLKLALSSLEVVTLERGNAPYRHLTSLLSTPGYFLRAQKCPSTPGSPSPLAPPTA